VLSTLEVARKMSADNERVRFGVIVPQGWRLDLTHVRDPVEQFEAMTRVAQVAERVGFDSIWLYDHFHTIPDPRPETTFECWTTTAALARETRRVRVGQLVTCVGYRHPALLAKMASTVDVLSRGRLNVGIGAGWYADEWNAYGMHFPETRDRLGRLAEACEILHHMWTESAPVFHGRYYSIHEPINAPPGVQQPHPPLWIGGGGERVTLRLVARWGSACNVGGTPDVLRHKFDVLWRHCDELGRDYDSIVRSTAIEELHLVEHESQIGPTMDRLARAGLAPEFLSGLQVGTPAQIADRIGELVTAGANYIIVYLRGVATEPEQLEHFAREVMPRVTARA
jgi:F420-dependent oxidoreductase-like protein